jgi:hypothetical protein
MPQYSGFDLEGMGSTRPNALKRSRATMQNNDIPPAQGYLPGDYQYGLPNSLDGQQYQDRRESNIQVAADYFNNYPLAPSQLNQYAGEPSDADLTSINIDIDDTLITSVNESPWSGSQQRFGNNPIPYSTHAPKAHTVAHGYDLPAERPQIQTRTSNFDSALGEETKNLQTPNPLSEVYEFGTLQHPSKSPSVKTAPETGKRSRTKGQPQECYICGRALKNKSDAT